MSEQYVSETKLTENELFQKLGLGGDVSVYLTEDVILNITAEAVSVVVELRLSEDQVKDMAGGLPEHVRVFVPSVGVSSEGEFVPETERDLLDRALRARARLLKSWETSGS